MTRINSMKQYLNITRFWLYYLHFWLEQRFLLGNAKNKNEFNLPKDNIEDIRSTLSSSYCTVSTAIWQIFNNITSKQILAQIQQLDTLEKGAK